MNKILHYGTHWPAYVQERNDTPPIYRTGSIAHWKEGYEQRQKERQKKADITRAKNILKNMIDTL